MRVTARSSCSLSLLWLTASGESADWRPPRDLAGLSDCRPSPFKLTPTMAVVAG